MKMKKNYEEMKREIASLDPGNLLMFLYITTLIAILVLGVVWDASATTGEEPGFKMDDVQRGELLVAMEDGQLQPAPLLDQQVQMKISGITARVQVEQRFVNHGDSWVEAVYVYPLPDECSVDHLSLQVGERQLEGQIMEKEQARKTHETAREEGRKSSLLVQNRPNIFTTKVANIGPGEEVSVIIEYQQTVRYSSGVFSLRFPMVVGPRYIPGHPLATVVESLEARRNEDVEGEAPRSGLPPRPVKISATGWAVDTDQVPDASEITPPVDLDGNQHIPVDMSIDLAAGIPLARLESLYHGIETEQQGDGQYSIRLTKEVKADRDFVLEWQPVDTKAAQAALFAENKGNDQYLLLMLMPPQELVETPVPREMIFILDVSGSMAGESIVQAKDAISLALSKLRPSDHFNIITFSNSAKRLYSKAKPADQTHLSKARKFIKRIDADGGTEMKPALLMALDGSHQHERLRQVVFLTDGAVGNEDELLKIISRRLGDSRLFTVGIGSAPNSYFMSRAAVMGRGTFSYIGKQSEVKEKMSKLFAKLENPVISDLKLELAGSENAIEGYPSPLPDLYMGEPLLLSVKTGWLNGTLRISGTRLGNPWETLVDTTTYGQREGIAALWARKKIRSKMESLALGADEEKVREEVLQTALEHHLVSRYTSLVAVDTMVSRPEEAPEEQVAVKTHLPQGWQANAVFGGGSSTATPAQLRLLLGMALLMIAALLELNRRRRWHALQK